MATGSERIRPKQHPAHHYREDGVGMTDRARKSFQTMAPGGPLQNQKNAVVKSPRHKGPTGSMPEPAQEKNQNQVEMSPHLRLPVAAQRNIDIIAKPCGK